MKISSSLIIHFIRFFSNAKIMEIAIASGFIKRRRSLLPDTIVKVFVFGLITIINPSLNQIASKCEEFQLGLTISKNAVFKKLPSAANLLKSIFANAMTMTISKVLPINTARILSQFKDVKICDSTKITLPDKLTEIWPGLGGRNARASLKIQGIYSLLSSSFTSLELTKSPGSDTVYSKRLLDLVDKGELLITDLGYYCKDFFNKISEKGAYFLTRVRTNTIVCQEQNGEIKHFNLAQFINSQDTIDEEVFIGVPHQKQLKCRLIAIRLPVEVVNERRRKANQKAKQQDKQLTKDEIAALAFNIIITNVSKRQLPPQAALDLYRARWQIELVFKACKSYLKLDKIGLCGQHQLECLIYGRLIAVITTFLLYNMVYSEFYRNYKKGISILLFTKLITDKYKSICENMKLTIKAITNIEFILYNISKRSLHEKRSKKTSLEVLQEHCFT
jgi:hypothetical protein